MSGLLPIHAGQAIGLECFPNVMTEVMSFLTHGDCGRLFFVSKQWREKLLEPAMVHFLLRRHKVIVSTQCTPYIECRFPWNCCIEAVPLLRFFINKGWINHPFMGYSDLLSPKEWCGWFLALHHGSFLTALHLGMDTYMFTLRDRCPISSIFPMNHFYGLDPLLVGQWLMRYNKFLDFEGFQWARVPMGSWKNIWDVIVLIRKYRPDLMVCSKDLKHTLVLLADLGSKSGYKECFKGFTDHLKTKYGLNMSLFHIDTFKGDQLGTEALNHYQAFEEKVRPVACVYDLE